MQRFGSQGGSITVQFLGVVIEVLGNSVPELLVCRCRGERKTILGVSVTNHAVGYDPYIIRAESGFVVASILEFEPRVCMNRAGQGSRQYCGYDKTRSSQNYTP